MSDPDRERQSSDVWQAPSAPASPAAAAPGAPHAWTWFLRAWSGFNAAVFALVVWATVSVWPPRGTAGDYETGPGTGLFYMFFAALPGAFAFFVNAIVFLVMVATRSGRRAGVLGWWLAVATGWIAGLAILAALGPSGRPLPP